MNWHSLEIEEIFKILKSRKEGLTKKEAEKRLKKFGSNEIKRIKRFGTAKLFLRQFLNLFVLILILTILLCLFLGKELDAWLIAFFVFTIVFIGFFQEYKVEKILEALKKLVTQKTIVIREGREIEIDAKKIVPGDIIVLNAGEKVPADCRIIEATNLEIDESLLTGESLPVSKISKKMKKNIEVAERRNMAFMGTVVTSGKGKGIVVNTGMNTEMGKIARVVQKEKKSEFKVKMELFAKQITLMIATIILIIFFLGVQRGTKISEMFLFSIALAISAIPESLPFIITVCLALGARKAAQKNALFRRIDLAETLGRINVICCDKTGTLTKNEMTVQRIFNGKNYFVSGIGYKPKGTFLENGKKKINPLKDKKLFLLLKTANLCNDASLENDIFGNWWVIGSPTEGCLLTLVRKAGLRDLRKKYKLIAENPFDNSRKRMSSVYEEGKDKFVYVKGAPENILDICKISKKEKRRFLKEVEKMAKEGFRILAFAYKKLPTNSKDFSIKNVEKNLNFLGIVGILDPIREEVKDAIKIAREAGIRTIIVSGDHEFTVLNVARKLGIEGKVITGKQLEKLSEKELEKVVEEISIYARILPEHKLRIVNILKKKGYVVAMTGDGINDAPALKFADVGIAMGIKGTEVAKEASDLILLDDNFKTIVEAVKEGRRIFENIQKATLYLLATSLGEVLLILTAIFSNLPLPLTAIQILWINIVTEGIPACSLAFEKEEYDLMKRKAKKEKHLIEEILPQIIEQGVLIGIGSFFVFVYFLNNLQKAITLAFNTLVFFEIFNLLNSRSLRSSIFKIGIFSNKAAVFTLLIAMSLQILAINFLTPLLGITKLSFNEFLLSVLISSSILIFGEIRKFLFH